MGKFVLFEKFMSKTHASNFEDILKDNNIPYRLDEIKSFSNASHLSGLTKIINKDFNWDLYIEEGHIKAFIKAWILQSKMDVEGLTESQLDNEESPLFGMDEDELLEIVTSPESWGCYLPLLALKEMKYLNSNTDETKLYNDFYEKCLKIKSLL